MSRKENYARLMRRAVESSDCETPMSATIVKGGRVLSVGYNRKGYRGSSIHAEMDALRQLRWQKNGSEGADIHIFRFGADGSHRMSKPCRHCFEALAEANISRIFYHDYSGKPQFIKVSQADSEDFYTIRREWHTNV
jgi:deoxycytidylate deaminase